MVNATVILRWWGSVQVHTRTSKAVSGVPQVVLQHKSRASCVLKAQRCSCRATAVHYYSASELCVAPFCGRREYSIPLRAWLTNTFHTYRSSRMLMRFATPHTAALYGQPSQHAYPHAGESGGSTHASPSTSSTHRGPAVY